MSEPTDTTSTQSSARPAAYGKVDKGDGMQWERGVLEKVAMASITEQRRARRWGIFFRFLLLAYLTTVLVLAYLPADWMDSGQLTEEPHTALVELAGVIAPGSEASAEKIIAALQKAYDDDNTKAVVLRINSPGGSPVQAGQINDEIRRLRKEHEDVPLYAVVDDLCASGGYYVAAAADAIYVDKASVVGSIGVIMAGFGFTQGMNELGVERRLLTAGEHKALMDPFSPEDPVARAHLQKTIEAIHDQFIAVVKEGRGDKLVDDPKLFSGLVWTGEQAIELGLADALGSAESVARDVVKAEDLVDFTRKRDYLERFADRFGAAVANTLGAQWLPGLR